jgi:excinuclease UvrABC nuclease subunit
MIDDTLSRLQARLENISSLSEEKKQELLLLFGQLKEDVADLSETQTDRAESITRFTEISTHEATRAEKNEVLHELSIKGLKTSVEGFEASHPRLAQTVNSICNTLSNLGI